MHMLRHICFGMLVLFLTQTALAQQQLNKTLVHDGNTRNYTVYIPATHNANNPIPLLFNFHGGSGNIASQLGISDMRPIADTANFILVYPQAFPDPNDGGSTNWTHKPPTNHDDIHFVDAMIQALSADYAIDANRVYACGYSNGGEFSFELACRLSTKIAAIGVVARSMYVETFNQCSPTHPTGILTIHGTKDDYNGIVWAGTTYYLALDDVNTYWSNFNNTQNAPNITPLPDVNSTDGSTVERHVWPNGNACVSVEHLKVLNGGHDWPGSFGNMDIDASAEIWRYVSQFDLNGRIGCLTTNLEAEPSQKPSFNLVANPVHDVLSIKSNQPNTENYQLFSLTGKLLASGVVNIPLQHIDVSSFHEGIYLLKIGSTVFKVVKE